MSDTVQNLVLWGSKKQQAGSDKNVQVPLAATKAGALRVALESLQTMGLDIDSIPQLVLSSMPNVTLNSQPALTSNPSAPMLLAQCLVTNSDTTVFTSAENYRDCKMYVTSVDSSARTAQVSLGALDDTHSLVKALPVGVGSRTLVEIPYIEDGDVIHATCDSTNKVVVQLWGVPVTTNGLLTHIDGGHADSVYPIGIDGGPA